MGAAIPEKYMPYAINVNLDEVNVERYIATFILLIHTWYFYQVWMKIKFY